MSVNRTSPLSAAKKYSRGTFLLAANCRMKHFQWKLFALSTWSFRVSIEKFEPFFFFVKNVLLNFKMSQMHVSHSHVAVDLGKILQCGSAENKTAKLVEDIASKYSVELQALKNLEYFE